MYRTGDGANFSNINFEVQTKLQSMIMRRSKIYKPEEAIKVGFHILSAA